MPYKLRWWSRCGEFVIDCKGENVMILLALPIHAGGARGQSDDGAFVGRAVVASQSSMSCSGPG
jgi:hypothetical protein